MTKTESKELAELIDNIRRLTLALSQHKQQTEESIQEIKKEVRSHPIILENDFNKNIQQTIIKSLDAVMSGYSSPIKPIIDELVKRNKHIIESAFLDGIESLDKEALKDEIKDKLIKDFVKNSINSSGGMVDKFFAELKQDKSFRARLTVLIDNVVRELQNDFLAGE